MVQTFSKDREPFAAFGERPLPGVLSLPLAVGHSSTVENCALMIHFFTATQIAVPDSAVIDTRHSRRPLHVNLAI